MIKRPIRSGQLGKAQQTMKGLKYASGYCSFRVGFGHETGLRGSAASPFNPAYAWLEQLACCFLELAIISSCINEENSIHQDSRETLSFRNAILFRRQNDNMMLSPCSGISCRQPTP